MCVCACVCVCERERERERARESERESMTRHVEKIKQGQEVWVSGVERFTLLNRVVREDLTKKVTRSDNFPQSLFLPI